LAVNPATLGEDRAQWDVTFFLIGDAIEVLKSAVRIGLRSSKILIKAGIHRGQADCRAEFLRDFVT
jgi:hypothetical protein